MALCVLIKTFFVLVYTNNSLQSYCIGSCTLKKSKYRFLFYFWGDLQDQECQLQHQPRPPTSSSNKRRMRSTGYSWWTTGETSCGISGKKGKKRQLVSIDLLILLNWILVTSYCIRTKAQLFHQKIQRMLLSFADSCWHLLKAGITCPLQLI